MLEEGLQIAARVRVTPSGYIQLQVAGPSLRLCVPASTGACQFTGS